MGEEGGEAVMEEAKWVPAVKPEGGVHPVMNSGASDGSGREGGDTSQTYL
jgi:hypothetical protein